MPQKIYSKSPFRANQLPPPGRRQIAGSRWGAQLPLVAALVLLLASCSPRGGQASAELSPGAAGVPKPPSKSAGSPGAGSPHGSAAQSATASSTQVAPTSGAYVSFVTGTVTSSQTAGSSGGSANGLRVGDPVRNGEVVSSGKSSAAEVRIGSEFDIGIGEQTTVRFTTALDSAASNRPSRLSLHLDKGTLQIKAGASLIDGALAASAGGSSRNGSSLLLEVSTPLLFISSRGGSLLVSAQPDRGRAAVGAGQAWVLPQAVVYSDIAGKLRDRRVLDELGTVLSNAVPVSRHEELTVSAMQLVNIDRVGVGLRKLLMANLAAKQFPPKEASAVSALTTRAANEVQSALGKPRPLTTALRKELDPSSVPQPKMKTTSVTSSTSSSAQKPPSAAPQNAARNAPQTTTGGSAASTAESSPATGSSGAAPPSNSSPAPASSTSSTTGTQTSSQSSSSGNAAVGSAVLDALNQLFGATASGGGTKTSGATAGGPGSAASATGGTGGALSPGSTSAQIGGGSSTGSFPGPTPPTPPTPPSVP